MAHHVRLLGILWMARAGMKVMAGLWFLYFGQRILPWLMEMGGLREGGNGFPQVFLPVVIASSGWFILLTAAASLAVGMGLYNHNDWARPLALLMGFLSLLSPVLGTALGIYTLWVLLPSKAGREYQQLARAA